jgi:hypothetical protein
MPAECHLVLVLGEQRLIGSLADLKSPGQRELSVNPLDAVSGVQVLDECDLIAGSGALARNDGGVSKEEFPDLNILALACKDLESKTYSIPSVAILRQDLLLVGDPVSVPSPQSGRVVNTDSIDILDLKSCAFNCSDIVIERSRSIGTREDISVHEKTPDEILILPALP